MNIESGFHFTKWQEFPMATELYTHWSSSEYWNNIHKSALIDKNINVLELVNEAVQNRFKLLNEKLFNDVKGISASRKELVFENIRMNDFSNLPSRKNCLFFCETKEKAMAFDHKYSISSSNKVLLELNIISIEQIHVADPELLDCNGGSMIEIEKAAFRYWSGENISGCTEVLFRGSYSIIGANFAYSIE